MNSLGWLIEWFLFLILIGDAVFITPWVWIFVVMFWPLVFFSMWLGEQ